MKSTFPLDKSAEVRPADESQKQMENEFADTGNGAETHRSPITELPRQAALRTLDPTEVRRDTGYLIFLLCLATTLLICGLEALPQSRSL